MRMLMKYELKKTLFTKLVLLGFTAAAQIMFLIGLYAARNTKLLPISVGLLCILAFGGVMVIGLQSVLTLHRDMNTKQSYMLFMTPNSCFKILGAKMLENGLSILLAGAFYFALGALDITLLFAQEGQLQQLWDLFRDLINSFNESVRMDAPGLACFFFSMLTGWISTVTAAFLADVISSALLNGKKFNGIVTFGLFLAIVLLSGWVEGKIIPTSPVNRYFLLTGAASLAFSGLMYAATAEIMEKKLSV